MQLSNLKLQRFSSSLLARGGFITLISSQLVDWLFLMKTVRKFSFTSLFLCMCPTLLCNDTYCILPL